MPIVDFATFCYKGDARRLHKPGHLKMQVESSNYPFNEVIIIHQQCNPHDYENSLFWDCNFKINIYTIDNLDSVLVAFDIDINKPQYSSSVDRHHTWKNHVVNHLMAVARATADYIVFADSDCWIIQQSDSWVKKGIEILSQNPDVFIVSPNDGEPERKTQTISQQMFLARTSDFRQANFNQPGYSGNPRDYPEMPEYHAMLEGRIHYYCKSTNCYRYVLGPEYRYWHFNRTTQDGWLETDLNKY